MSKHFKSGSRDHQKQSIRKLGIVRKGEGLEVLVEILILRKNYSIIFFESYYKFRVNIFWTNKIFIILNIIIIIIFILL